MMRAVLDNAELVFHDDDDATVSSTMDESLYSETLDVSGLDRFSVDFAHTTGTSPVGTVRLQEYSTAVAGWQPIADSDIAVPISGLKHRWYVDNFAGAFRKVRIYYAFTSGTAVASGGAFGGGSR